MQIRDLRNLISALPDDFTLMIETDGVPVHIRNASLEPRTLVLREHMLSVAQVVETVTAYDGVEYVISVSRVKYPKIVAMPTSPIVVRQLRGSLGGPDAA